MTRENRRFRHDPRLGHDNDDNLPSVLRLVGLGTGKSLEQMIAISKLGSSNYNDDVEAEDEAAEGGEDAAREVAEAVITTDAEEGATIETAQQEELSPQEHEPEDEDMTDTNDAEQANASGQSPPNVKEVKISVDKPKRNSAKAKGKQAAKSNSRSKGQAMMASKAGVSKPKKFTCKHAGCAEGYNRIDHLERHYKVEHLKQTFQCACGKHIARKDNLTAHCKREICDAHRNGEPICV